MKKRVFRAIANSFTLTPESAPARKNLLRTVDAVEKSIEETDMSSHFWAAGGFIRRAMKKGLASEQG